MSEVHEGASDRAESRIGTTLKDKWRLDRLLGVGGMAAVYAATHRNGKRAAVKVLHRELSMEGEVRTRFLREGYAANKIDHPGAVSVLDDDITDDGVVFLVMDLLEGETLAARAERLGGALEAREVFLLADRLLDVLAAAHAQGIVHRDIKPDNVFLVRDGGVRVLDFGIARLREMGEASKVTQTGFAMGTPAFMPPEQARGRWAEVDARTDLWAVGATMFALLTGRSVHVADTMNEVLLSAMTIPALPVGSLAPSLSVAARRVVDRALAYERADRWQDARSMQEAVRAAFEEIGGVTELEAPPMLDAERPRASPDAPTITAPGPRAPTVTAPVPLTTTQPAGVPQKRRSRAGVFFTLLLLVASGAGGTWWFGGRPSVTTMRAWLRARGLDPIAAAPPVAAASPPEVVAPPPSASAPIASASASASNVAPPPPPTSSAARMSPPAAAAKPQYEVDDGPKSKKKGKLKR